MDALTLILLLMAAAFAGAIIGAAIVGYAMSRRMTDLELRVLVLECDSRVPYVVTATRN